MKLDGSISAVVTGGASGLGEATARALAAQGVKVAIFDLNEAVGTTVAREIGGVYCKVDVSSDESVDQGFAKARAVHGQERVLVNCAGIAIGQKTVGRDKADPSVIKAGVYAMTLPVARDLMNEGVRVNTILPGIMMTPMMAGMPQNVQDALAASIPFPKRLGRPDEYASLVLEMARNVYLNGECVRLDGAIRMAPR